MRLRHFLEQWQFLAADLQRAVNHRPHRLWSVLFSPQTHLLLQYRAERSLYLLLGRGWLVLRTLLLPVLALLRPWIGHCEINFRADIGPGLKILHAGLGIVISGHTIAGENLTLIGGNCIGMRGGSTGNIVLGSDIEMGANAVVLGPVVIGDRVAVGAGAVVMTDAPDDMQLAGVPARPVGLKTMQAGFG